jgi:toxin-antitoxin system PIN domain toxin
VIAIDTNILVYAHREDSQWHSQAYARMVELAEGNVLWAIPWPCIHEFLAITTHTRIYSPPTPLDTALAQIEAWLESPSLVLIAESESYWQAFRDCLVTGKISGSQVHDARIAGLCLIHGVSELWTADRDFGRFSRLKVRNPLLD